MEENTDHDQLFKTVIREFFPDFLPLFFADLAAQFDLSAVKWLDKELFANPPDGPQHVLDLVAELTTLGGDATTLALIHVEVESADSVASIEARLPDYYHYLRRTKRKPVRPLVVFLKLGFDGLGTREIHDPPVGRAVATHRYDYVGLPALPAVNYLRGDNLVGVALSALMRVPTGGRIDVGVEALRRIGDAAISDGKKALLGDCVETYIELPAEELARFRGILEANATGRVKPVNKTRVQIAEEKAAERGLQAGMQQGMQQGIEKERKSSILKVLDARIGAVPADIAEKVEAMTDPTALDSLLVAGCKADSFDQFRATAGW